MSRVAVLLELLTLTGAMALAAVIFHFSFPSTPSALPPTEVTIPAGVYFTNPTRSPYEALSTLAQFLKNGDSVFLGSSELSSTSDTALQRFFPKACGRRIASFGAAGFQSLLILMTLNDVRASLGPNSRLTIILSPVWFTERGTPSATFLANLRPYQLIAMAQDPELPPQVRSAVSRQIRSKLEEFTGLYPDWFLFSFPQVARLLRPRAVDYASVEVKAQAAPPVPGFDWAAARDYWLEENKKKSGGNPLGTTQVYWDRIKGDKPPFPSHKLDPWMHEKKDLFALSDFLKSRGVRAHFILQPVHRRVYKNFEPYDKLFAEVEQQLKSDGHLWTSYFVEPFDLTILQDSQHFSDSAWVRIEQAECSR